MLKNNYISLIGSLVLVYITAFIGSFFTVDAIGTWYAALIKPELNPPSWIFGPVWTALYVFMAVAAWRVYVKRHADARAVSVLFVYGVHLVVNAFWSIAFFGMHNPELALGVIAILWALIVYLLIYFYRIDRLSGYLLIPYLAWVSFASYLNWSLAALN